MLRARLPRLGTKLSPARPKRPPARPRAQDDGRYFQLSEEQIDELTAYIIRREKSLDRHLLPYCNPTGKDVLAFGCGFGNEVLWAARHRARSVLAVDQSRALSPVPCQNAMRKLGIAYEHYEFRRENIHDTALSGERYDLIVSNSVFEHVMDLKGVLGAFRGLLRPGGRVVIFSGSLWYSSIGGHVGRGPWEHLTRTAAELKPELSARHWDVLCNQLNRMTVIDFLQAVRSVGMIVLQLRLGPDPNLDRLVEHLPRIRERGYVSPTDLSIESLSCELCFEENL
jgi:SAM-dependent methyltransferase